MNSITLLQRLIAIDSTTSLSNLPMVELLEREVRALGFETRRLSWTDEAGVPKANLVAQRGPPGGLALVGHTDCVPYDKAWSGALSGEEREGRLFGRGSADTKGFIAAAVSAASRSSLPLSLLFTADEEVGCLGARRLLDEKAEGALKPAFAIVGEPTRMTPVLGHKGYCLAEIVIMGAEGHSAYPETGASAIFAAGRLLRELEQVGIELQQDVDPLFAPPFTTLNVGLIAGGKAKNVIPGSCTLTLEWRPLPSQDVRRVLGLVEAACARVAGGGVRVEVRPSRLDAGVAVPRSSQVVQFLEAESGRAAETIPFSTELPYLSTLGADACVFGPGDIRVAHRTGEFIPINELQRAEEILARAIQRFAPAMP